MLWHTPTDLSAPHIDKSPCFFHEDWNSYLPIFVLAVSTMLYEPMDEQCSPLIGQHRLGSLDLKHGSLYLKHYNTENNTPNMIPIHMAPAHINMVSKTWFILITNPILSIQYHYSSNLVGTSLSDPLHSGHIQACFLFESCIILYDACTTGFLAFQPHFGHTL